jgi:hypothetical protein
VKQLIEQCATWIVAKIQILSATFDPEILQWPGGALIAMLLLAYTAIKVAVARLTLVRPDLRSSIGYATLS